VDTWAVVDTWRRRTHGRSGGHFSGGGGGRFGGGPGGHFSTRALAPHAGIHSRFAFRDRIAFRHHRFAFRHRFVRLGIASPSWATAASCCACLDAGGLDMATVWICV